jgi:hypothetical protein
MCVNNDRSKRENEKSFDNLKALLLKIANLAQKKKLMEKDEEPIFPHLFFTLLLFLVCRDLRAYHN